MITREQAVSIIVEHESTYPGNGDLDIESGIEMYRVWKHFCDLAELDSYPRDSDLVKQFNYGGAFMSFVFMTVRNLKTLELFSELIDVSEDLLKIQWTGENDCMIGFAKNCIASAYADMGDTEKSIQMYEKNLCEDDSWGWGWLQYAELFRETDFCRLVRIYDSLYERLTSGEPFTDQSDIIRTLIGHYYDTEQYEKAEKLLMFSGE